MATSHVRTKDPVEADYIRYVPTESNFRRQVLTKYYFSCFLLLELIISYNFQQLIILFYQVAGWMRTNLLLILTVFGVFCGFLTGFLCRYLEPSQTTIEMVSFPGELLMRMLKMLILPLIISSLITGMAQLDAKSSGRMGSRALVYYMSTTVLAAIVGIIMVVSIHPGDPSIKEGAAETTEPEPVSTMDALLDIARFVYKIP